VIIVMMGVAGAGKTAVGRALADALHWPFFDADDFHPPENIARMRGGVPLSDAHREPWLAELRALLQHVQAERANAVLACSALKAAFREQLRAGLDVRYAYLQASADLIAHRLRAREGHFMPPELLESQFATLDEPEDALALDASAPPDTLVAQIRAAFGV
jgi:gluconokinase